MEWIVVWLLKGLGLFWVFSGVYAVRQARGALVVEQAISALSSFGDDDEAAEGDDGAEPQLLSGPHEAGRSRWLIAGGVLTLVSGLGLMISHGLVLVPLGLLVFYHALYMYRQKVRISEGLTAKQVAEEIMSPQSQQGVFVALGVWGLTVLLVWVGVFG